MSEIFSFKYSLKLLAVCAMVFLFFSFLPLFTQAAHAQVNITKSLDDIAGDTNINLNKGGPKAGKAAASGIVGLVGGIISTIIGLIGIVFLILLIYAGFLWLTAAGREEPIKKAKGIIKTCIIGIVIIAFAYAIVTFILGLFTGSSTGGSCVNPSSCTAITGQCCPGYLCETSAGTPPSPGNPGTCV